VRSVDELRMNWNPIRATIYERIDERCDEQNLRTIEIFMQSIERDVLHFEEVNKDKIWINYKILENYVNDLYVK